MDAERFNSAYRFALGIVLVYVLWMLVPHVVQYTKLVAGGTRRSQTREAAAREKLSAARPKLSAANLESALRQAHGLGADSQIRCEAADRDWDYGCSLASTWTRSFGQRFLPSCPLGPPSLRPNKDQVLLRGRIVGPAGLKACRSSVL